MIKDQLNEIYEVLKDVSQEVWILAISSVSALFLFWCCVIIYMYGNAKAHHWHYLYDSRVVELDNSMAEVTTYRFKVAELEMKNAELQTQIEKCLKYTGDNNASISHPSK